MSYNIDSVDYISGKLRMTPAAEKELLDAIRYPPENCFLHDLARACELDPPYVIHRVSWSGEGSGRAYEDLLAALSKTQGEADLLLTWERGDCFGGVRVRNGKVTEHEIEHKLGREIKRGSI